MRALVVYESMFGNTHEVAERIGAGLRTDYEVEVVPVGDAIGRIISDIDLVVVGGPTHAHGMSRPTTRSSASDQAGKDPDLHFEAGADGPGLREWLQALPRHDHGCAAAFDTRVDGPELLTGSASRGIAKRLVKHGFVLIAPAESFLVDRHNRLLAGEAERAEEWAEALTVLTKA